MQSPHVRPHVGRVLGAIVAVGTVEARQLTALKLEVIVQIVLAREHVATARTGERLRNGRVGLDRTCEQKGHSGADSFAWLGR